MSVFAVTYVYSPDAERLDAFRPEHRAFLGALHEAGSVIVSGPLKADDAAPAGALILLDAPDVAAATALLEDDPFRREGLIAERGVREWVPVIGSLGR
ncbi:YciI family protein [Xylanimonas sp. McL0601]|uniref:YciI family protein n=1 Tax=Xylanimonas sp. McL0601 TaxID=3414739 RepID=UPI003CEE1A2F